ncbi:MAG: oligosaccharide flippase family protein [Candidatus Magasanikbacteria bacterium]|nr:oligosaccharide flippase family protein [Candidatus Magasanikbacteria bacterium]
MSLTQKIAKNTALQIGGKIISTALGLLAIAIMTRSLGALQFGWYATAIGFVQFVGIMADFGFAVTISNIMAEPRFEKRAVLNTLFTWRLITAVVIHGLAALVFLFFPYSWLVKQAVLIISLSFLAISLNNVFIGYCRAELKLWHATVADVLGRVILVGAVLAVAYTQTGFLPMIGATAAAALATVSYLYFKIGEVKLEINREISRDMFTKMWPTALAVMFNAVYLQGDRVILPLYTSQINVGLYSASYRVLDVVIQLSAILMGIVMPLITYSFARGEMANLRSRYQLALDWLALLLLPITVGMYVVAEPLIRFIASAEFSGAAYMMRGLSISIVGTCFGMVFGHVALAINRQKQALWIYGSDAILSLIGYFIFIPRFGVAGAIGVTIFSEIYAGVLLMILVIYYSGLVPKFWTLLKIALASAIMGILVKIIAMPSLLLSVLFGAAIFFLLTLLLRITSLKSLGQILKPRSIAESPELW